MHHRTSPAPRSPTSGLAASLAALALMVCAPSRLTAADAVDRARQALAESGIRGGLVVYLGPADGRLAAALHANPGFLVHVLDRDPARVAAARESVQAQGLYGAVTVETWVEPRLPYRDNLVNLLVAEDLGAVPADEVTRVLAPNGVACLGRDGNWTRSVKPRPAEMDEWTHYLYTAAGNAVSHDRLVAPPRHLQWLGSPRWSRHHDHMASLSALVATGGRLFYILDGGPTWSIQLPSAWSLVARDAFSGVILWQRPIEEWYSHYFALKSGPAHLPRRLVAVGDRVYTTLGINAPLSALDAATGETLRTYEATAPAAEVITADGVLYVVAGNSWTNPDPYVPKHTYVWDNTQRSNKEWAWSEQPRRVLAIQADSGRLLWQKEYTTVPLTLTADGQRVFLHDGQKVVCLDPATGDERWASAPVKRRVQIPSSYGPTVVAYRDVLLFAGGDRNMTALDAATGKTLWTAPHPRSGHASPEDLLVINDLAWAGDIADGKSGGVFSGRDLHTGEVKAEFAPDVATYWFHHRCYRSKATDRFILTSRTGVEFLDPVAKHWTPNHWVRGGCLYGVLPANGLVYAPPQACGCYLESKLNGFSALAPVQPGESLDPGGVTVTPLPDEARLERGPAYDQPVPDTPGTGDEWPTYRHDAARSGATPAPVPPAALATAWETAIGGRLTSPVVAGNRILVAATDSHTVHALDAATGQPLWHATAGGRIDSPPTVHAGRVLFGCADGRVYCLRATDGALVWRFLAAPQDRRLTAWEQVESVWPVPGSVLLHDGAVWTVAGRSLFVDGGLRLLKLDPATGRKLLEEVLDDRDPESGQNLQVRVRGLAMPVAMPDVLVGDGPFVFMRSQRFGLDGKRQEVGPIDVNSQTGEGVHLFCQIGLLDDSWFHRSYWTYGRAMDGGYGGWYRAGRLVPQGRILAVAGDTVYGYGRKPEYMVNTSVIEYELFAADSAVTPAALDRVQKANGRVDASSAKKSANSSDWQLRQQFPRDYLSSVAYRWAVDRPPVLARGLVLAGPPAAAAPRTLFVAGPPDVVDEREAFFHLEDKAVQAKLQEQAEAFRGSQGGLLVAVAADDGRRLAAYRLPSPPVFDGLIAAAGRLYLSTLDGEVVCLAGAGQGRPLPAADVALTAVPPGPQQPPPPVIPQAAAPANLQATAAHPDFSVITAAQIGTSDLGYRVQSLPKQDGLALRQLPTPLTQRATFRGKLRCVAPEAGSGYLRNGLLVFGNGPAQDGLVKCGLRVAMGKVVVIQGAGAAAHTDSADVTLEAGQVYELTVTVDLAARTVSFACAGQTVQASLAQPLAAVTHVGYSTINAVIDASPIEVRGE